MHDSGREAGRARGVTPRRRGAKVSGGAKRGDTKTVRIQLHLEETVVERLGVHASLKHRDKSRIVNEILTSWLARYGEGREIFAPVDLDGPEGEEDGVKLAS